MANIYLLPQLRLEETTREQENKNKKKYSNIYFWAMQQFSDITEKDLSGHDDSLDISEFSVSKTN